MADQSLVEDGALKGPVAGSPGTSSKLLERTGRGWRFIYCSIRYLLTGASRGVPGVADFVLGDHFFKASQVPSELRKLGEMVSNLCPDRAMEIGTKAGGTLFFLTKLSSRQATIVSVDLPRGRFGGGYGPWRRKIYQRFARRGQRLHLLQCDSHSPSTLRKVKGALADRQLDYLFIDGDHTYDGVKKDFELYAPMVRSGGIIALHDIAKHPPATGCEVSKFWNEIKSQYRHREIIESPKQGWAGIGVLCVD